MKKQLTLKEEVSLTELFKRQPLFVSPGSIGGIIYKQLNVGSGHSSTGSPVCKKLCEKGYAVRNENGFYKITDLGIERLDIDDISAAG